jgi:hypothetical protein
MKTIADITKKRFLIQISQTVSTCIILTLPEYFHYEIFLEEGVFDKRT